MVTSLVALSPNATARLAAINAEIDSRVHLAWPKREAVTNASASASAAATSATNAATSATNAATSATNAELFAESAQSGAEIYDSVALGRNASADTTGPNSFFQVKKGGLDDDGVTLLSRQTMYKRTSVSTQTLVSTIASGSEIDALQTVNYIKDTLQNLFTLSQLNFATLPTIVDGTRTKINVNSEPALQISTNTGSGTSRVYWRIPVPSLDGLTTFSVSLVLVSVDVGTSGEFRVIQRDSGGATLTTNVVSTGLASAISTARTLELASISLNASAANLDFDVTFNKTSGDKTRTAVIKSMLLRAGSSTAFAFPPTDVATITATVAAQQNVITEREKSRVFKNSWPDPAFKDAVSPYVWQNGASSALVTKNGVKCIQTSTTGVASSARTLVDVSNFKSGKFSASFVVHEKIGNQGANGIRVRLTAHTSNTPDTIITNAWTGYTGSDFADNSYYTRLIPTTDINGATTFIICEGFTIPATATHIGIDIRTETTVAAYISNIVLREGSDATYKDEYKTSFVYVSPTGNDTTGTGLSDAPYATINKAIDALSGTGTVVLLAGSYSVPTITPSKVKNITLIGNRPSLSPTGDYTYPIILSSSKITGITKTSGRTKIYQATVAGLPALSSFNWAYQDGVADPRSLIDDADRSPQHRGRTNRIQSCARLIKPSATILADALTEMDSTTYPTAFVDSGILYFTIVGGGDGTLADIYLDASVGLIASTGVTKGSCGVLNIVGLDIRYGALDLMPFSDAKLKEVSVTGARNDCINYNVLSFDTLEVSCGGSQNQYNGDGLNGHSGARLTSGIDLYAHDNWDDGFSDHEGCSSRLHGGLVEYNGGTGIAPAYGSDHVSYNVVSRRNQQRGTWKPAAYGVIGTPSGASPAESGYDTLAWFFDCVDIESLTSFSDGGSVASRAICVNCKSIRPTTKGYANYKIIDCGYIASGSSTSKSTGTIVENTTIVT